EKGSSSLRHGSRSPLPLLKRRFLARSPALPSSPRQQGSGENAGLLLGTTTPKAAGTRALRSCGDFGAQADA
ncbi:unnamed protein product, partial [Gulo gulo]